MGRSVRGESLKPVCTEQGAFTRTGKKADFVTGLDSAVRLTFFMGYLKPGELQARRASSQVSLKPGEPKAR